jgi:hypothetical protein
MLFNHVHICMDYLTCVPGANIKSDTIRALHLILVLKKKKRYISPL